MSHQVVTVISVLGMFFGGFFQQGADADTTKKKVIVVVAKPVVDKVFVDSLNYRNEEKKELSKKIDSLLNDDASTNELKTVIKRLEGQNARLKRILYSLPANDLKEIERQLNQPTDSTMQQDLKKKIKELSQPEPQKKRGFFKRVFGGKE